MRLMPILTAALVSVSLYFLIFERETVLAIAQVGPSEETADETGETGPAPVSVVVETSQAQAVDSAVVLRGRTEAAREVTVAAETSGQVISEPIRKGAFVEAGALLCKLDPGTRQSTLEEARGRLREARARLPEAQARVPEARARRAEAAARLAEAEARRTEAEARLDEARINENAAARLSEGGFASETRLANAEAALASARAGLTSAEAAVEGAQAGISSAEASIEGATAGVEAARAGIQSAQAAVAAAERELDRLTITAPFEGLLESDTTELGTLMQPGSPCATVIQLDPIKLVGFVPEADVAKVETGAMAGAELSSGERVQGPVTFLSRSADQATRTFRVEIEVPNPDLAIRDGQTAEILIGAEGRSAHLLAASSLTLNDDGDIGVRAVDDADIARFHRVSVLRDTVEGVWVTGLPDSLDVIVVGQEYVRDGVPVAPTYREANG